MEETQTLIEFGEDSDEEENYTANIDTVSENLPVYTTTILIAFESVPTVISDVENDIQDDFLGSSTQAEDDSESDVESDNGYETASEWDEPAERGNNFAFYDMPEEEDHELCDMFRQGFVFKCFALLFLHFNSEEGMLYSLSTLFVLVGLGYGLALVVQNPMSVLWILHRCMSKRTMVVAVLCMTLLYHQMHASSNKLYLNCVILIKVHGILRRQDLFPAVLKLYGSGRSVWSTLWHLLGDVVIALYWLEFSFQLDIDDVGQLSIASLEEIGELFESGLTLIHYSGWLILLLSVFSDGWLLYAQTEPTENQRLIHRVSFCFSYLVARLSETFRNQKFFYLTIYGC